MLGAFAFAADVLAQRLELTGHAGGRPLGGGGERGADLLRTVLRLVEAILHGDGEVAHEGVELGALVRDFSEQVFEARLAMLKGEVDRLLFGGEIARDIRERGRLRRKAFDEVARFVAGRGGQPVEFSDLRSHGAQGALQIVDAPAKILLDLAELAAGGTHDTIEGARGLAQTFKHHGELRAKPIAGGGERAHR